jgi:transglutaminase-like putative cysteine protease
VRNVCLNAVFVSITFVLITAPTVGQTQPQDPGISRTPDGARILHRRIPSTDKGPSGNGTPAPVFVYDPVNGGALPRELHRDGQALPRPSEATEPRPGEAVYSSSGVSADQPSAFGLGASELLDGTSESENPPSPTDPPATDPSIVPRADPDAEGPADPRHASPTVDDPREGLGNVARPDMSTEIEGVLDYRTVFDPSIVPFKRNRALDVVQRDLNLGLSPRRRYRTLEPVGNRLEDGREAFWGSVVIEGDAGERLPLPSVSPESRILSYETSPPATLTFEQDSADNFYITPSRSGRLRVVFVVDASTRYFGRGLPIGLTVRDVPPALRPKVPRTVRREADRVAAALGLNRRQDYATLLNAIVAHFRGFQPGEPPDRVGSIYEDLALGGVGICRHRGYGFVITAQALGIPARYVFNEAHVFVEAYVPGPDPGWVRIDLGGGAEGLTVHGGKDKTLHHPQARDPFDRPTSYANAIAGGQTAGATQVQGMPSRQRPGLDPTIAENPGTAAVAKEVRRLMQGVVPRAQPRPDATQTRTTLTVTDNFVFRGDALEVVGTVHDLAGNPVRHGEVRLLLLLRPENDAIRLLGTARIDSQGRYRATIRVGDSETPGEYEVVAEFAGSGVYGPSASE